MLGHPTSKDGEVPIFENSDEELVYPQHKHTHLEEHLKIERPHI
jgi:hypothetical protein